MGHQTIALIADYGLLLVFLSVLAEQLGLPVPALAVLVVGGALAAAGQLGLPGVLLVALVACLFAALRMARITPAQLSHALAGVRPPLVVDVRSAISRQIDPRVITGALLADPEHIDQALSGVPPNRELVIYCNCPNEATSARAAKTLIAHGYRDVRPLPGGLSAWGKAGYAVQYLPVVSLTTLGG